MLYGVLERAATTRKTSTKPATAPTIRPAIEIQRWPSQRSSPMPIAQPIKVDAGSTKASWIRRSASTTDFSMPRAPPRRESLSSSCLSGAFILRCYTPGGRSRRRPPNRFLDRRNKVEYPAAPAAIRGIGIPLPPGAWPPGILAYSPLFSDAMAEARGTECSSLNSSAICLRCAKRS